MISSKTTGIRWLDGGGVCVWGGGGGAWKGRRQVT